MTPNSSASPLARFTEKPPAEQVPDKPKPTAEIPLPAGALYLHAKDVHHLSKILGQNILSVDELFKHCQRLTTIRVGGVDLTLEPGLIERLYSRAAGRNFTEFLNETVKSLLCGFTGY